MLATWGIMAKAIMRAYEAKSVSGLFGGIRDEG
jgi:hypothetical protein